MLTELRYIAGQLRRAQRHLAVNQGAGVANAIINALATAERCIEEEQSREKKSEPWTPEEILAREG